MRLFNVVLFILFNIYSIESNSNRTDSEAEKLIKFRSDKNENGIEENLEKSGEVYYEEYEYSDDGTLYNNILKKGDKIENSNTELLSGKVSENFPNEVFLSLRNITADAATAFRGFTNKNADLLASASDNLNVTFNGTFDENESEGIKRVLEIARQPSELTGGADVFPTYQPYSHKNIDTADLSDCALQGEWKPMGVAHKQIIIESDGGSHNGQTEVLQSVGSYVVPNKIIPYWQNNFASGNRGVKIPQNHKPFGAQGNLNNYGSAYGYGVQNSGANTGFGKFFHSNGFSSAEQFQKIKSSSMLSPPPYPPIIIGKKPGFYKYQKSKHKFYNYKRPRPNVFSDFSSSSYGGDVKGGSFGGHLSLNNGAGVGSNFLLASGNYFKQDGEGSFGLNHYKNGGNLENSEIHLGISDNGKTRGQKEGGGFSIFAHNSNLGNSHANVKDLLHYGGGIAVGGKGETANLGSQVLLNQKGENVAKLRGGNFLEASHVDLLHPGNKGLLGSSLVQEENGGNKVIGALDVINHSPPTDISHNVKNGITSAYTQEVSGSSGGVGHSTNLVQSGNGGIASLSLQQESFGNIVHSGNINLLHPGEIAVVSGRPQSSALQTGNFISGSTISSNNNYEISSSKNKDIGIDLSSELSQGATTVNLITSPTNTFNQGSIADSGIGNSHLSMSGINQVGHSGSSYVMANLGQLSHDIGQKEKLLSDPPYLKTYYGQSIKGGNSLLDTTFLSSQISQDFQLHNQDPSTFTCGKNHDHNTNYHTATFQVADNDHPSSVDVLQYQGDSAVLIKAESIPFQDKVSPERKNYNSLEAEPSSEIISQTAPLSVSIEHDTEQTEKESTKTENDEEPEHKSYYHEITKVIKVPATSVGNIRYTYSEYETEPQTFAQEAEINNEEHETERPQIIKELEQLTNKFQLDPNSPKKLFEDTTIKDVNFPLHKDEHHHEEAEGYHYTSQDHTVKNQAHNFVTEFPSKFTSTPPVQLIYKKPYVKYVPRPGNNLLYQKPKTAYFSSKAPVNLLRKQKPIHFNKNQNYNVQEQGGPIAEIFPTQKSPKHFYNLNPNFAGSKSGYQVNFSNGKVIKKITTTSRQKTLKPILVQKYAKISPQVIRVVKVSV